MEIPYYGWNHQPGLHFGSSNQSHARQLAKHLPAQLLGFWQKPRLKSTPNIPKLTDVLFQKCPNHQFHHHAPSTTIHYQSLFLGDLRHSETVTSLYSQPPSRLPSASSGSPDSAHKAPPEPTSEADISWRPSPLWS